MLHRRKVFVPCPGCVQQQPRWSHARETERTAVTEACRRSMHQRIIERYALNVSSSRLQSCVDMDSVQARNNYCHFSTPCNLHDSCQHFMIHCGCLLHCADAQACPSRCKRRMPGGSAKLHDAVLAAKPCLSRLDSIRAVPLRGRDRVAPARCRHIPGNGKARTRCVREEGAIAWRCGEYGRFRGRFWPRILSHPISAWHCMHASAAAAARSLERDRNCVPVQGLGPYIVLNWTLRATSFL
jgi:hypothetical protein